MSSGYGVDCSPDGQIFAVGGANVFLYNASDFKLIKTLPDHGVVWNIIPETVVKGLDISLKSESELLTATDKLYHRPTTEWSCSDLASPESIKWGFTPLKQKSQLSYKKKFLAKEKPPKYHGFKLLLV